MHWICAVLSGHVGVQDLIDKPCHPGHGILWAQVVARTCGQMGPSSGQVICVSVALWLPVSVMMYRLLSPLSAMGTSGSVDDMPEAMLVFKGQAPTGPGQSKFPAQPTSAKMISEPQTVAKNHFWVHGPAMVGVCVDSHSPCYHYGRPGC